MPTPFERELKKDLIAIRNGGFITPILKKICAEIEKSYTLGSQEMVRKIKNMIEVAPSILHLKGYVNEEYINRKDILTLLASLEKEIEPS